MQKYEVTGNLVEMKECSSSNGVVTVWTISRWTLDGLNRLATARIKDGADTANSA